jgi:nucleolar MIF4G domain-containing protein 1
MLHLLLRFTKSLASNLVSLDFVHNTVGILLISTGAYFVQHLVAAYETHYAAMDSNSKLDVTVENENPAKTDTGKEASNLLVLLTELYNFQVISCVLIYDIIRLLLDGQIFETDVELLLKITRSKYL